MHGMVTSCWAIIAACGLANLIDIAMIKPAVFTAPTGMPLDHAGESPNGPYCQHARTTNTDGCVYVCGSANTVSRAALRPMVAWCL